MLSFLDLKGALACQITKRSRMLSFLDLKGALACQIIKRSHRLSFRSRFGLVELSYLDMNDWWGYRAKHKGTYSLSCLQFSIWGIKG